MPSLKQITRKISSVKGTRRIMSAMKLIAAVKLQRSQSILNSYRPYSNSFKEIVAGIARRSDEQSHALLRRPDERTKAHLVFLTSDRGLCGSFNSGLIRRLEAHMSEIETDYEKIAMSFIGRRGRDHFSESSFSSGISFIGISENNYQEVASELSGKLSTEYKNEEIDEIILVYNYFKSALTQEITFERLLPIDIEDEDENSLTQYLYEPSTKRILDVVIPKYIQVSIERAIFESLTSEHASRMTAMENATSNADDVIRKLTLIFNKTRQAMITTELMDIVNGTEAQKQGGNE